VAVTRRDRERERGRPGHHPDQPPHQDAAPTAKQGRSRTNGSGCASASAALAAVRDIGGRRNDAAATTLLADTAAQLRDAVNTGARNRVSVLTTLAQAAQAAGVACRDAENTVTAALQGAA
jgi:hypothetical protein